MTSPSYLPHNAGNKRLGTGLLAGSYGEWVMCRVEDGNYTHDEPLHSIYVIELGFITTECHLEFLFKGFSQSILDLLFHTYNIL